MRFRLFSIILFSAMTLLAGPIRAEDNSGPVVVIAFRGEVSTAQFFYVRRCLKKAERDDASAVILDMDTYGGSLAAAVDISDALSKTTVPTYTYINTNAGSAGALIAVSTRHIYMAPISAIGAAAPIAGWGDELPSTMKDKTVSYFSGYFRSAAERNGHNPELAEAFINKDKEVKIGDTVINNKGSLLTLSAQEATRKIDGKPVLAEGTATSVEDLAQQAGLRGPMMDAKPLGFEKLARLLTALGPLFLLAGLVCGYIEFKLPGFGIFGITSMLAFALFFAGQYVAGLAGWEAFALFVVGVALVLTELIVLPGSIAVGLLGVMFMLAALVWGMTDFYPNQPLMGNVSALAGPLMTLGGTVAVSVIIMAILARFLPHTRFFDRLVLGAAVPVGASLTGVDPESPTNVQPGQDGVACSPLRPAGKAKFGDRIVDVVSQGDFIAVNTPVRIIEVAGPRVVVEAAPRG